jgi:hypothetical protein
VVIIECDQHGHRHESVLCEVTRILDVAAQHRMRSDLPLHFICFNPDGYSVDGRPQKPRMAERHKELLLAIEESGTVPLRISYMCYGTTAGVADVINSDEFPPDLRDACKTRIA